MLHNVSRLLAIASLALLCNPATAQDPLRIQIDVAEDHPKVIVSDGAPLATIAVIDHALESCDYTGTTLSVSPIETFPKPAESCIGVTLGPDPNMATLFVFVPDNTPFKLVASLADALNASTSMSITLVSKSRFSTLLAGLPDAPGPVARTP